LPATELVASLPLLLDDVLPFAPHPARQEAARQMLSMIVKLLFMINPLSFLVIFKIRS
jgi:hypothetical protein